MSSNSIQKVYSLCLRLQHMCNYDLWQNMEFKNLTNVMGYVAMSNIRGKKFIADQCKRMFNEIENGWYSHSDIIFYVLNQFLLGKKFDYGSIRADVITETRSWYSNEQFEKDVLYIAAILKESNLPKTVDLFIPTECGEPFIYPLVMQGLVKPRYYMNIKLILLTDDVENNFLFSKSDKYKRFERISDLIRKEYYIT
jgi:hypothetical protein